MSNKSRILVYIQFSSFAFFALAGSLFATKFWLILQFLGLFLGLWGVLAMKMGNFNIQPEVKNSAIMISRGPYKIIRNPMYSGLILFFGISVFVNFDFEHLLFSVVRLFVFMLLTTVLLLKITMEEQFLSEKFGAKYLDYKKNTFKLLPYIF